jgi:UDP-glucose:(heptosyl)LPS alpha-1,3-glucosyltransferase
LAQETFLREYPRIDSNRVQVIHPGVDIRKFSLGNREECRQEMRKKMHLDPKDFLIIFVSMNFEIKGLAELMAGLAKLKSGNQTNNFRLLVIGKGNINKFLKLAQQWEIQDQVLFFGALSKEELARFYLTADVFAMLSKFDTFGITVLEAMAASLPVLVSTKVGAKDVVKQGENGFIIADPASAEEIADRLAFLMDEEARHKMAKESRITACDHSWETVVQKVQSVYEHILN